MVAFQVTSTTYVPSASGGANAGLPAMKNVVLAIIGQYAKDTRTPPGEFRQLSAPFAATVPAGAPGWNAVTWTGLTALSPSILVSPVLYMSTDGYAFRPVRALQPSEYVSGSTTVPIVLLGNLTGGPLSPSRGTRFYGRRAFFNSRNAPVWIVIVTLIVLGGAWFLSSRQRRQRLGALERRAVSVF